MKSRIVLALVLAACVPQLARAFLGRTSALNTFYNINIAAELILLSLLLRNEFTTEKGKLVFRATFLACFVTGLAFLFTLGVSGTFLSHWLCLNNLTYTAWILVIMLEVYRDDVRLLQIPPSILCYLFGIFVYASCTILIFSLWQYIMTHRNSYLNNLWIIHDVFNVIMYLSFTAGFVLEVRSANRQSERLNDETV